MATVSFLYNNPKNIKEGKFPLVIIIRNKGTHSHIPTGIKLQYQHWDPHKLIKKGANGITDHLSENAKLIAKLANIQSFITDLTATGEISNLTAAQITERYNNKLTKEKYNFNTYFQYVFQYTYQTHLPTFYNALLYFLISHYQTLK